MHTDVERLIFLAKERGFLTLRQREMILNKAQELGDDITEVEFFFDDIPTEEEASSIHSQQNNSSCPNNQAPSYFAQSNTDRQKKPKTGEILEKNEKKKKKKKKGKWILVIILVAAIAGIVVLITVPSGSNYNNYYYNNINYTNWDDELARYDNGLSMYVSELSSGRSIDEIDNEYQWLTVLQNNIENAAMTGQLTSEQEYRFNQIQEKYANQLIMLGIGSGAMYLINQLFN